LAREQKGFVPGFVPDGRAEDKGWYDVLQVNRRDPRKSFHAHRRATASCRIGSPAAKEIVEAICSARGERTFTPGMASNVFAPKATSAGRTSRPCRMRSHPALAQRSAGEFEVLAYKVGVPCNRRGGGFSC
jgi:hypothetical protein